MKEDISETESEGLIIPPYLAGWGDDVVRGETGLRSSGKEFVFLIVAILITMVAAGLASAFVVHPEEDDEVQLLAEAASGTVADTSVSNAASIDEYSIADTTGGTFQIPVNRAIDKLSTGKGASGSQEIAIER